MDTNLVQEAIIIPVFHRSTEEWNLQVAGFRRRATAIRIPPDIEPSQGKGILSQLDNVYGEVRILYGDIFKQYNEAERLIERIRRKAEERGNNTEARKANGIRAVETVELGNGQTVNLYNIFTQLEHQKQDIESILDIIKQKQSMVITMSGLLKIESNIAGH